MYIHRTSNWAGCRVLIEAGGALVGAIGVSGAPGGERGDLCAAAGIGAIEDDTSFWEFVGFGRSKRTFVWGEQKQFIVRGE